MGEAADPAGPAIRAGGLHDLGWAVAAPGVVWPETFDGLLAAPSLVVRPGAMVL